MKGRKLTFLGGGSERRAWCEREQEGRGKHYEEGSVGNNLGMEGTNEERE